MSIFGILAAGFLLGLRHALEPDHLAAMASISAGNSRLRERIAVGSVWGVGHGLALLAFGGMAVLLGDLIPETLTRWLEAAVGLMLVYLGVDVLRRIKTEQVHIHAHTHVGQSFHAHFHSHRNTLSHHHMHRKTVPYRALLVGMVHGLAGSAALTLLVVSSTDNPAIALAYVVIFGLGSLLGMTALSVVISVPLISVPEKARRRFHGFLAMAAVIVGLIILGQFAGALT